MRVHGKFIDWIKCFDKRHADARNDRFDIDPEAASCEAYFWAVLADHGIKVEPNDDVNCKQ